MKALDSIWEISAHLMGDVERTCQRIIVLEVRRLTPQRQLLTDIFRGDQS